ncbi:MAG: hypothetical protein C5B47_05715, partial [Verrucomicrobia bacterium]
MIEENESQPSENISDTKAGRKRVGRPRRPRKTSSKASPHATPSHGASEHEEASISTLVIEPPISSDNKSATSSSSTDRIEETPPVIPAIIPTPVYAEGVVEVSGKGFGFLRESKRN